MGDLLEEMLETEERVKKTLIRAIGESFGQFSIQLKEDQSNWNKKVLANLAQSISSVQTQLKTGHSRDKEELIRALRQQLDAYNESKKNFSEGQEALLAKATTNCRELIERNKEVVVASLNQELDNFTRSLESSLEAFTDARDRADNRLRKTLELLTEKIKYSNKDTANSLSMTASKLAAEMRRSKNKEPSASALLWELYNLDNDGDGKTNGSSGSNNPFF